MEIKEILFSVYKRFLTWFGDLYFATKPPLCRAREILAMMALIQPGDIICRGYTYYLDGYFIPGDYSHSGVVLDKNTMAHSIAEGVGIIHPIDFVKDTDRFIILRSANPNDLGRINALIERARWHVYLNATEYDFTFQDDNKYYCHEFSVDCLKQMGIEIAKTKKTFGVGIFKFHKEIYLAQNMIDVLGIIFEFNPKQDPSIL